MVTIIEGTWWARYGRTRGQPVVVRVRDEGRYIVLDFQNTMSLWLRKQQLLNALPNKTAPVSITQKVTP